MLRNFRNGVIKIFLYYHIRVKNSIGYSLRLYEPIKIPQLCYKMLSISKLKIYVIRLYRILKPFPKASVFNTMLLCTPMVRGSIAAYKIWGYGQLPMEQPCIECIEWSEHLNRPVICILRSPIYNNTVCK